MANIKKLVKYPKEYFSLLERFEIFGEVKLDFKKQGVKRLRGFRASLYSFYRALEKEATAIKAAGSKIPNVKWDDFDPQQYIIYNAIADDTMLIADEEELILTIQNRNLHPFSQMLQEQGFTGVALGTGILSIDLKRKDIRISLKQTYGIVDEEVEPSSPQEISSEEIPVDLKETKKQERIKVAQGYGLAQPLEFTESPEFTEMLDYVGYAEKVLKIPESEIVFENKMLWVQGINWKKHKEGIRDEPQSLRSLITPEREEFIKSLINLDAENLSDEDRDKITSLDPIEMDRLRELKTEKKKHVVKSFKEIGRNN